MIWILVWILVWIVCGFFVFGAEFAYNQRKYSRLAERDYYDDMRFAFFLALLGPFSLVISFLLSERFKYGFLYPGKLGEFLEGKKKTKEM